MLYKPSLAVGVTEELDFSVLSRTRSKFWMEQSIGVTEELVFSALSRID